MEKTQILAQMVQATRGGKKLQLREETKKMLFEGVTPTHIERPHVGWDYTDIFDVYEVAGFLVIHVIEESWGLGSEWADSHSDVYRVETEAWVEADKKMDHWEDGKMQFNVLPNSLNEAKYLLGFPPPEGFYRFGSQEYQDFEGYQPKDFEYVK